MDYNPRRGKESATRSRDRYAPQQRQRRGVWAYPLHILNEETIDDDLNNEHDETDMPTQISDDNDVDDDAAESSIPVGRSDRPRPLPASDDDFRQFDLPNRIGESDPAPSRLVGEQVPTADLSKKELALRKRRNKRVARADRSDSLDLLDPEVDVLPWMTTRDQGPGRSHDWVISPDSPFVTYWLAIVYLITVYNLVVIPFRMSFGLLNNTIGFWFFFDLFTDLIFIVDIYLNHHFGIYVRGRKVLNLKTIAIRYRRSWLPIDICASIPLDLIQIPAHEIVPAARLPRLLRAVHILDLMNSMENQPGVNIVFVRLTKLAMFTMFLNHFAACTWFALGQELHTFDRWKLSRSIEDLPTISQYIRALYWTTTQMSGRGIHYLVPDNIYEATFSIVYILSSSLFSIYIVSTAVSLVVSSNAVESAFQSRIAYITTFVRDQGLPRQLQVALQEYFSYVWQSERGNDSQAIIQLLPSSIAQDIQMFLVEGIVVRCRMFSQIDQSALAAILNMLTPRVCAPGEIIIHAGVMIPSMYFIQQGELDVLNPIHEQAMSSLVSGDAFGEMQVFLELPPPITIRARTFCNLFEFTRDNLKTLIDVYPADAQILIRTAKQMRHLSEDDDQMNHEGGDSENPHKHQIGSITGTMDQLRAEDGEASPSEQSPVVNSDRVDPPPPTDDNSRGREDDDAFDMMEKGIDHYGRRTSETPMPDVYGSRKSSIGSQFRLLPDVDTALPSSIAIVRHWELLLIVTILYNFVVVPIRAGALNAQANHWAFILFDVLFDIVLVVDIVIRSLYPLALSGEHRADASEEAQASAIQRYHRAHLPIHAAASMPIDWFVFGISINGVALNVYMRSIRFLRLETVTAIVFRNHRFLKSNALLMFTSVMFKFVLLTHVMTMLHSFAFPPEASSLSLTYTQSLILVINALTGLGGTGLDPRTNGQMIMAMLMYMIGVLMMAVCIASLASYITERNSLEGSFSRDMASAMRFLEFTNAPEDLKDRTRVYFDSVWSTMRGIVPKKALQALPSSLRTKIMIELCRNVIKNMPIFQGVSDRFIYDFMPNLEYEVFPASEFVVRRGQMTNGKMYFVTRGVLSVILDEDISTKPFKLIGTGSFFGECALLTSSPIRRASIRAETCCHALSISKTKLMHMFTLYPIFGERMRLLAAQRVKRLDKTQRSMQQTLQEVIEKIEETRLIANRTYNFTLYEACFVGSELVNWVINKGYADNREDAVAIGIALLEKGMIRSVNEDDDGATAEKFADALQFYRVGSYVDRMATSDVAVLTLSTIVVEDHKFINELLHRLVTDRAFQREANLISAHSLIQFLLSTDDISPDPVSMAKAEDNAQELAQRLIDFSAIQNTKNFEYFENTEAGYYRLRALNASDPQNSGPAAMAKLLNGKTPAYSGSLLIRGTSTFVSYFGILSTGYPSTICLYASKHSEHPIRVFQTVYKSVTISKILVTDVDIRYDCIHLVAVEAPENDMMIATDIRCERDLILCFDRPSTYQTLLDILKAQGYSQKIRSLTATQWSSTKRRE